MYVQQAKPANAARTPISTMLMGISESGFDYPPTNERRCAFQSRIKYTSKGEHFYASSRDHGRPGGAIFCGDDGANPTLHVRRELVITVQTSAHKTRLPTRGLLGSRHHHAAAFAARPSKIIANQPICGQHRVVAAGAAEHNPRRDG